MHARSFRYRNGSFPPLAVALAVAATLAAKGCQSRRFNSGLESRTEVEGQAYGAVRTGILDGSFLTKSEYHPLHVKGKNKAGELIGAVASLTEAQRSRLYGEVERLHGEGSEERLLGGLRLFRRDSWLSYLRRCLEHKMTAFPTYSVPFSMAELPDDIVAEIRGAIVPAYSGLSKERLRAPDNPGGQAVDYLGPKRCADSFLSHTAKPFKLFRREIQAGRTPLQALDSYLSIFREAFARNGSSVGQYDAADVHIVAKEIHSRLRKDSAKIKNERGAEEFHLDRFIFGGSFPNGRAVIATSDVDAVLVDTSLRVIEFGEEDARNAKNGGKPFSPFFERAHLDAITEAYGAKLKAKGHREVGLDIVNDNFAFGNVAGFANLNPVVVSLSREAIELWIYSPEVKAGFAPDQVYQLAPE